MLNSSKSLVSAEKSLSLPSLGGRNVRTWGGLQPVYVTTMPKSFCWDSDYSNLTPNAPYVQLLKDLGYDVERDLKFKFKGYYQYTCENPRCPTESVFLPVIFCGRYHPHVSFKHVSRVVARCLEKVSFVQKHTPADYLVSLDLTCPRWVSERAGDFRTLKLLRKAVNRFLLELRNELFRNRKSQLGGVYAIHTWKTTNPLEPHLHVHLSLFNVAYNSRKNTFHRFQPIINHLRVKRAWRKALASVGFWDNPNKNDLPVCHVHYFKLSEKSRLIHRLRYIFRKPIVDLNRCSVFIDNYDQTWAIKVLNYTPRQVQVGFMVRLKKLGFICRKSFSEFCPVCGEPLRKLDFIAGNCPDVPHYIRQKGKNWEKIPPPAL